MKCPLCFALENSKYDQDKLRSYFLCHKCFLIFVPRESILSAKDEARRYEAHQNHEQDPYYRDYLSQIVDSTRALLPIKGRGLDFGCGKTTLLSKIYQEFDFQVDSYDLHFHPNEEIWKATYDFIVLSEVVEHLSQPIEVMEQLTKILHPGGQFFIKTKFYPDEQKAFGQWFYKRDQTHVQFFNQTAMKYLADHLKMRGPNSLECQDLYELKFSPTSSQNT